MRQFLLFIVVMVIILGSSALLVKQKIKYDLAQPVKQTVISPTPTPVINKATKISTSVFIPYWTLDNTKQVASAYDQYLYFGVTPDSTGIGDEAGKEGIVQFTAMVPERKKTLLVLRMIDPAVNTKVLKDKSLQEKIIKQTTELAQQHGFSGVVLDLEFNALPFQAIISQITSFTQAFAKDSHARNLTFQMTVYGDTFYRVRPFEIKTLAKDVDKLFIMAYDFHKSRGNPGPNFPLQGKETYGYDYEKLTSDFLDAVPAEKLSVVFGMFGYDWEIDKAGNAISYGEPLTYKQIQQKFLESCPYTDCVITHDKASAETKISYTDAEGKMHVVWFEDAASVKAKQTYLKQRGISQFSYWAYSYY